ncbi:DUF2778 domain-containing protein [Pseudomonas sp. NPDC088444]|uniref:DUF2778 domain-containing protein n=1 Tax=Pseudomonas sp. NPDC088444 TaxID=3364456 RepID=UPI00384D12AF
MSTLVCPGVGFFPAYSGQAGSTRNNPDDMATPSIGPLPTGRYYIVNRPTGRFYSKMQDKVKSLISGSDRDVWFGLFKDDGSIDDNTFIQGVQRGMFRLHPAGHEGVSEGCITLPSHSNYSILRAALLNMPRFQVTPTLTAYGAIQVY